MISHNHRQPTVQQTPCAMTDNLNLLERGTEDLNTLKLGPAITRH